MLWKCRAPQWIIDGSASNAFTEEQYDPLKLCKSNIACPTFFKTQMQKLPSKTELQADFLQQNQIKVQLSQLLERKLCICHSCNSFYDLQFSELSLHSSRH